MTKRTGHCFGVQIGMVSKE